MQNQIKAYRVKNSDGAEFWTLLSPVDVRDESEKVLQMLPLEKLMEQKMKGRGAGKWLTESDLIELLFEVAGR